MSRLQSSAKKFGTELFKRTFQATARTAIANAHSICASSATVSPLTHYAIRTLCTLTKGNTKVTSALDSEEKSFDNKQSSKHFSTLCASNKKPGTVKLRNGSEEPLIVVKTIMEKLRSLDENKTYGSIALDQLYAKAKNPDHKFLADFAHYSILGDTGLILKEFGLVQQDGTLSASVKNVALSAIKIDEDGKDPTKLRSPIALEKSASTRQI